MWAVKGQIPDWLHDSDDEELDSITDSYIKRLWGNHEAYIAFEGFDAAWEMSIGKKDKPNEKATSNRVYVSTLSGGYG